jgi:predicted N-acyltransferase
MSLAEIKITVRRSIADISAREWDACANPAGVAASGSVAPEGLYQGERHNPFLSHAFLHALEASGAVGARAGWAPFHLAIEDERERIVAVTPCYLKSHSQGEYVFDHAWADAYERAGGDYYPKLQVSVPFTPVNGRRLLVADESDAGSRQALIAGLRALRQQTGASSVHITFPTAEEWQTLSEAGFLQRTGQQFHFFNAGYAHFDEFLSDLASRKRKTIRREREAARADGIDIEWVTGRDLTEAHWDAFFAFYMDTGSRKWGRPYLNRKFFSLVGEAMADRILLVMAKRAGRYIAGALNFIGDDALYGRNWGAIEEHPFLHFEVCYYQALEFGITRGLKRVEAGAQGEHKLARGYRPVTTYSAHDFADPRMTRAIGDYLNNERRHIEAAIDIYGEHVPFRKVPEPQCR